MPSVQQLLLVDVSLLLVLAGCVVLLLRRALQQGRAKKALLLEEVPAAVNPFVQSRVAGPMTHAEVASVFAPQHAVPEVRRPLWSDSMPVLHDAWIDDAVAPAAEITTAEDFVFALEAPPREQVALEAAVEEPAPHLPREQVGILFLDDDQDVSELRLAEVTEFAPRPVKEEVTAAVQFEDAVLADPIDGVAFEPGEEVVPCACGAAYRPDTAEWLRESAGGECVLCHRVLGSVTRRMPGDLLAASA